MRIVLTGLLLVLAVGSAGAANFGSTLANAPNLTFGCEAAIIIGAGGPILAGTGQTTCTFRDLGDINGFRIGSLVPANGRITRIRVRSGPNPAPLQLTIFTGSPGLCCTARRFGKVFQPVPNGITTQKVNIPVRRVLHRPGLQTFDVVGISAVGPGTLPLFYQGTGGTFTPGTALTQQWFPVTALGDPRVEGTTMDGLELLLQWTFKRR